jgi:acetate kinase
MNTDARPTSSRLVLTLNGGSSSLKMALFDDAPDPARIASASVARIGTGSATFTFAAAGGLDERRSHDIADHESALELALTEVDRRVGFARVGAIGYRVVHGGPSFDRATRIGGGLIEELRRLAPLDVDHLPAEIAIIEAMLRRAPTLPQVACFDTSFHHAMPRVARLVPVADAEALGIRRYGFHGLSYTYLLEELERLAGPVAARGHVIMAHLGSGASLAAVKDGRPVDTTMGFTPTSGIPMGTRSGDLDPGVIVHLLRARHLDVDALDEVLNKRSGLLAVSGSTSDMRDLLEREATTPRAADAVALFCYQAKKAIGALAAAIGGLDTLVFAGGIGERSAVVRGRIAAGLEHLGVRIDGARNDAGAPVLSPDGAACTVRLIPTDEERIIARETWRVVRGHEEER